MNVMNTDKLLLLLKRQIDKIKALQNPNFWQQPEFRNFDWNSDESRRQNDYIKRLIHSGKPFFIGRYGTVELNYFIRSMMLKYHKGHILNSLLDEPPCWPIKTEGGGSLMFQAGVFPYTNKAIENFGNIYENASKSLDCLLTWITQENYLYKYNLLPHSIKRINFRVIEISFRAKNSWLSALKDRKVLIVSPFAELMEQQYKRKDDIYASTNVSLPDFDLKTVTAVNSNGYSWQTCGFNSWFEALNMLKSKIADIDFDIALLGCGAYAFPLASFCKELGKQAITTCGSTELLFGLYGTRWKNLPEINSAWIRPGEKYMPEGGKKIEDGAYW